jgi:hypothetical protein
MENMIDNPICELDSDDMLCLSLKKGSPCVGKISGVSTICTSLICTRLKKKNIEHHVIYKELIASHDWAKAVEHRDECLETYRRNEKIASMEASAKRIENMYAEQVELGIRELKAHEAVARANELIASIKGHSLEELEALQYTLKYGDGFVAMMDDDLLDDDEPIDGEDATKKGVTQLVEAMERL